MRHDDPLGTEKPGALDPLLLAAIAFAVSVVALIVAIVAAVI